MTICAKRLFTLTLTAAALVACGDQDPTGIAPSGEPLTRAHAIVDASNGAQPHFYFLAPIAEGDASWSGIFDATLSPTVRVCRLAGGACAGDAVAEFSLLGGTIAVDAADEHYRANWKASVSPADDYRIEVLMEGNLLGYADVDVAEKGANGPKAAGVVSVNAGSTLPIKFRLEKGLASCGTGPWVSRNQLSLNMGAGHTNYGAYNGTYVVFGGGVIYGTAAENVIVGYNPDNGKTDLNPDQPYCAYTLSWGQRSETTLQVVRTGGVEVSIRQETFAPNGEKYVLVRYTYRNEGDATVAGLRTGFLLDWDAGDYRDDVTVYDAVLDAGKMTFGGSDTRTVGMTSALSPLAAYAGFLNAGWTGVRMTHELIYGMLAGGIQDAPAGPADVRQLVGFEVVDLAPGATHEVVLVLAAGEDNPDYGATIARARALAATLP